MTNRHFGKTADVFKHLVLSEALVQVEISCYLESHAGSAIYRLTSSPERDLGVRHFLVNGLDSVALAASMGYRLMANHADRPGAALYPGSPAVAMTILRERSTELVFFDTDHESLRNIEDYARTLGLTARMQLHCGDGVLGALSVLSGSSEAPGDTLILIDPFDLWTRSDRLTSLELARRALEAGLKVVMWYGYESPWERTWAFRLLAHELSPGIDLWCADLMYQDAIGLTAEDSAMRFVDRSAGPSVGFGIVLGNLPEGVHDAAAKLGRAFCELYHQVVLPSGLRGRVGLPRGSCLLTASRMPQLVRTGSDDPREPWTIVETRSVSVGRNPRGRGRAGRNVAALFA